ncbi:Parathyroid hormone 2 receptor [Bulinus truncatus]|nr:Parathyroid hormone 2 receptor [Bulinus truncatus]
MSGLCRILAGEWRDGEYIIAYDLAERICFTKSTCYAYFAKFQLEDNKHFYILGVVRIHVEEQSRLIIEAKTKCELEMAFEPGQEITGSFCNMTWDGIVCWPATRAGETVEIPCPNYINNFYIEANATKTCLQNGEWFQHPEFNSTWSNYSSCHAVENISEHEGVSEDHADRIKIMYSVGYGVSLIALTVAIFIMIYFRRLHCPRNTIHLNLFMAFVLRALLSFLKDSLHDIHLGQSDEVEEFAPGRWRYYRLSGSLTSSAWVFIEGLYLYVLVTVTIFSERRYIRWCTLLGWAGPLLFLVPWVIIRATLEDDLRLGKSTLVLIPIFGVHYLVTIGVPDNINPEMETVKLYFEMFFNSFQVQTEIRKRYIRHKLRVNSRKFHNKYVTTASSQVRPRTCPSCSPRYESREINSSSGSDHNLSLERQKLRIYIQPMRYYRAQPPISTPIDIRPIIYSTNSEKVVA